jgi:5-formyltetrahydrofolate cyclo-ligase
MRSLLARMTLHERAAASRDLVARLTLHPAIQSAHIILLYSALPSEPDLSAMPDGLPQIDWAYPDVRALTEPMTSRIVRDPARDLIPSEFGPLQPDPARCPIVDPSEIDVCLVPGLAFDETTRARLGRGGGHFDRFLSLPTLSARKVGVGFRCQSVPNLPREAHDVLLDEVFLA